MLVSTQRKHSFRPSLEVLEDRITPYVLSGYSFASPSISASYMPDGTWDMGYQTNLFALYNATYPTATWEREFAKVLQTWADSSALNFHFVSDDGSYSGIPGLVQGNPRFGDIRLGATVEPQAFGNAWYPGNSTSGGDITLPGTGVFDLSSNPNFYSVLLHHVGCALGLSESNPAAPFSVVTGTGPYTGLYPDDIAGIQALYGARQPDAYDAQASNATLATATLLTLSSGGVTTNADISTMADLDYYKVTAPTDTNGTLSVSVDSCNLSLFDPKISVYDAAGNLLTTASAASYGSVATVNLSGLAAGQTYLLQVRGATGDVFGMGAYKLTAQFGSGPTSTPNPPSGLTACPVGDPQIDLAWTNNAANATGYVIERSLDGVSWTQIASITGCSNTSYTDTTVADGLTYDYQVCADIGSLCSSPSNMASVTLSPAAPGSLIATAISASQINLAWGDVSGETGFKVERSTDGVSWTQIATTAAGVTSYQDVGLAAGTTYTYQVCAGNAGGDSADSNQASATLAPAAPAGLTASTVSASQINLAWGDVSGATGFKVERSLDAITWTQIATTGTGVTSYQDTGLTVVTTYYYQVRASNAGGDSATSNQASTSLVPTAAPTAPSGLSAKAASASQINLSWSDVAGETGFKIERSQNGVNWTLVANTVANVTSFQNTGLNPSTVYYYRVRAINAGGDSAPSSVVKATTLAAPPIGPFNLVAVAILSNRVYLSWTDNSGNEQGFRIQRSSDGGKTWSQIGKVGANVTTYTDTHASHGITYLYRVYAYNRVGNSPFSDVAQVTTP